MSVYRFNPASVGFAALTSAAADLDDQAVPSATIGTSTVSPTGRSSNANGAAHSVAGASGAFTLIALFATALLAL